MQVEELVLARPQTLPYSRARIFRLYGIEEVVIAPPAPWQGSDIHVCAVKTVRWNGRMVQDQ